MKLKFDPSQEYQLHAIQSLVGLFEGQPLDKADFTVEITPEQNTAAPSLFQSELGLGNQLFIDDDQIYNNLSQIQIENELEVISKQEFFTNGYNFSIEMETGTGKTYVYLRTIFELSQRYGFKKFIIVVPSVAIREGTLKNIEITADHFRSIYNRLEFEHFVYDSKKANRLRQFATGNQLQIMIINIDAFNKDTNIFNQDRNQLSGYSPREFIQSIRPIVLIDEPQSVDNTDKAKEAIRSLNPLSIFRFSATHTNPYNLVYRLDPVQAYQLKLVKQIVVASATGSDAQNDAYIKLLEVDNKKGIRAKIKIQVEGANDIKYKDIWVKQGYDLHTLSNDRDIYQSGYEVIDISCEPGNEFIDFNSGRVYLGEEKGGITDDLVEVQIKNTIRKHLDKELQLKNKNIKVLSLFFIDRVNNYRMYDESGNPQKGKYAAIFEKFYNDLITLPQYKNLSHSAVHLVHDGYFSTDKKGILKDTNGSTQADDDTYAKIMRNKEQLLSLEEPLKFIFSHSALREGWDNPNVFQICVLREVGSTKERRQTIGRGMRLPVNSITGEQIMDDAINKLTVIARESYNDFAKGLQKEYENDCGITFGKIPATAFAHIAEIIDEDEVTLGTENSKMIWNQLVTQGILDEKGKLTSKFKPEHPGFELEINDSFKVHQDEIMQILESYQIQRHIKKDEEPKRLKINKQIFLDPEFEELWNRIKHKTTYHVDYSTTHLIANSIKTIREQEKIEPIKIQYREDHIDVNRKGIEGSIVRSNQQELKYEGKLPDIISYLQKETELTRQTLVKIVIESRRLKEFIINPQKYMDMIARSIRKELNRLIIDGIKYEKITIKDIEWGMHLLKEEELKEYFEKSLEVQKSIFTEIKYESEVEKRFAQELDSRIDIKLFVKLPSFFKVETPIGTYNPDWAIVKHDDETIYLVRETKSIRNFEKLRNSESDKVRCGRKHFEALDVDFDVVTTSAEI